MKKQSLSKIPAWLVGAVVTALMCLSVLAGKSLPFLEELELKTYDLRVKLFGEHLNSDRIAIVAIDSDSISKLGRWPWPRERVAMMIEKLHASGARVIGLDILFTEPEESTGLTAVRAIREGFSSMKISSTSEGMEFSAGLAAIEEDMDNDRKLEAAIASSGNVILPLAFVVSNDIGGANAKPPEFVSKNSFGLVSQPGVAEAFVPISASQAIYPIERIGDKGAGIGHLNKLPSPDGMDRWEALFMEYGGAFYPSFALAAAAKYAGGDARLMPAESSLRIKNTALPLDARMGMLINYYADANPFRVYSFFDVANDKVNAAAFKDKIVLIGMTDIGLGDTSPTPVNPLFSGVEREATIIENILTASSIAEPAWRGIAALGATLLFGIITTIILIKLPAKPATLITAGLFIAYVGAAMYMFSSKRVWMDLTHPTLLLVINYLAMSSRRFWFTEKAKEEAEVAGDEANKLLGLTFQSKGMLEMAYEKFKKLPVDDEMKDVLYNLGLDFEKKRTWGQALSVYERIGDKKYKDVAQRIERLAGYTSGVGAPALNIKGETRTIMAEGAEKPQLGRYEITAELGRGAMGVVYKGRDPKINRIVAIKTLNFDEVEEKLIPQLKERFFREAQSAGTLNHPNILTIYDAGEDSNVAYIAMEFIDGKTLEPWARKENLLPLKDVLITVGKVADALDYAHTHGVVHRDIKPANIMVTKKNEIKVTDFGIARVQSSSQTRTGTVLGTPSYMSPEQVAGKKVDGRSDIFSLGVVLYELLTGDRPFKGDSIATLMYAITNSPVPPLSAHNPKLPPFCQQLIDKALDKDPAKRFQKAGEFVGAIKWCLNKNANNA